MDGARARTLFVFDCFGTLVSSDVAFPGPELFVETIRRHVDVDATTASQITTAIYGRLATSFLDGAAPQLPTVDVIHESVAVAGGTIDDATVSAVLWEVLGTTAAGYRCVSGAGELLDAIGRQGHTLRLLSNCILPGPLMRRVLEDLGLLRFIDEAVFSSDGGARKPQLEAFAAIGEGPFAARWMIGDEVGDDISPAQALGWNTFLVEQRLPRLDDLGLAVRDARASGS